jgi:peptide subunit release factor 1 (eRF1)
MPSTTTGLVRELSTRKFSGPTVSCYLDVDGRRFPRQADLEREIDRVMRPVLAGVNGNSRLRADLARVTAHVRRGFDRSGTRGLAIFCNGDEQLFAAIELPVAVTSQVVVADGPALAPLHAALAPQDRVAVLLMDRARARLALIECDELSDRTLVLSDDDAADDDSVTVAGARSTTAGARSAVATATHTAAATRVASRQLTAHARRIAKAAWDLHQSTGFERLVLAGPDDVVTEVERQLHPYVAERTCGRLKGIALTSPAAKVCDAAREAALAAQRRQEAQLVGRLRDAAASGHRAIGGLVATLDALAEHRLERLVVSHGYVDEGWSCPNCGRLARRGRSCPSCGAEMVGEADVVQRLIERARAAGARVDVLVGNADLDVLGRVGGFLRF